MSRFSPFKPFVWCTADRIFMKIIFEHTNLKVLFQICFFRNITHSNTLESKYNPQFYTRYKSQA